MAVQHTDGMRRLVGLLRPHAAGEGRALGAGAALSLAVVALHVARPWPLKWLVDVAAGHRQHGRILDWVPAGGEGALAMGAVFLALATLGAAAEYAQVLTLNGLGNRVLFRFRRAIFSHLVGQPLAFHEGREVGELITRVVYDTSRLRRGINSLLVRAVGTVALFTAILVVLLWTAPVLGLVLAAAGAVAFAAMRGRGRHIARAAKRQRKREGALAALVGSELARVRELQLYGAAASNVARRFALQNDRSLRREQKVRRLAAGLTLRVDVVLALGVALALGLGVRQVAAGDLTAGDLVLFLSYALALRHPMVDLAYQTARVGRTYACAERLARLAERPAGVAQTPHGVPAPRLVGALRFAGVSVKAPLRIRGGRKWTLRELTCELPAGRRIAVVGGNGAGKSTLLRLIPRLVDPNEGELLLDGRDLRDYQAASVRDQISVVFQDAALPGLTVRELIALGRPEADDAAIHAAARRAHVHEFVDRLPLGYDTIVRRGGELLSGGERRRLALACALLRDGRLWLLDEPTAGLDGGTTHEIVETLMQATRGRTTLWVTHDPGVVHRLDWVLALERGRLTYSGPPEPFLERPTRTRPARSLGVVTLSSEEA